jgi:hypothetical protein
LLKKSKLRKLKLYNHPPPWGGSKSKEILRRGQNNFLTLGLKKISTPHIKKSIKTLAKEKLKTKILAL